MIVYWIDRWPNVNWCMYSYSKRLDVTVLHPGL